MSEALPLVLLVALFGLMVGSFLNVCIGRLPAGESIVRPASRCPSCRSAIAWYDNVPVVGYLLLAGRCRRCHVHISARYPAVELATAAAFALQAFSVGDDLSLLGPRLVFTGLLIALFGTDLETQRLPNVLTLPGLVVGLLASLIGPPGLVDSLIGAAVGGGVLFVIRWGWKRATGVEGMGLGDVKMMAMIGAFLGWREVWLVLFLASLAGAVFGGALALTGRRSLQARLPFGTFLAAAAFAASLLGTRLLDWYLGFY
ncbi:MAG: A24 family peptidase [Vicinamibacterales bacterium]